MDEDVDPSDMDQVLWALSKAPMDACKADRCPQRFAPRTRLARSGYERVRSRWAELGLGGRPPSVGSLEEDR